MKTLKISDETYAKFVTHMHYNGDCNACLRAILGLPPEPKINSKLKYPISAMLPGQAIVVPWNRDHKGQARVGGINSAVARCNRMPGRRYASEATIHGLKITRIE